MQGPTQSATQPRTRSTTRCRGRAGRSSACWTNPMPRSAWPNQRAIFASSSHRVNANGNPASQANDPMQEAGSLMKHLDPTDGVNLFAGGAPNLLAIRICVSPHCLYAWRHREHSGFKCAAHSCATPARSHVRSAAE